MLREDGGKKRGKFLSFKNLLFAFVNVILSTFKSWKEMR